MIVKCCVCGRVKVRRFGLKNETGTEGWAKPIDPDPAQPGTITHQYCPGCASKLRGEIDKLKGG